MQSFFRWMKKTHRRKSNPAKGLEKVKVARRKPRPLRLDQIEAVLESGVYSRTRDIITIAAYTGLRLGEVVKIRGEDVDLMGMQIRSTRKGGLDHRIAIPTQLQDLAHRYPRQGWWFPSPHRNRAFPEGGGHILMKSASDRISKAIRSAGIPDRRITAHSLRHWLATDLLRSGVPVRHVQEILGHASLATTQMYMDVNDDEIRDGMNRVSTFSVPLKSRRRRRPGESATMAA
jgi:integrase/recombinase XerD